MSGLDGKVPVHTFTLHTVLTVEVVSTIRIAGPTVAPGIKHSLCLYSAALSLPQPHIYSIAIDAQNVILCVYRAL